MQDLIGVKVITFMPNGPNINNNPMPPHIGPSVSMIEECGGKKLVSNMDNIKNLLDVIKDLLLMNMVFPGCGVNCKHYLINPQVCEELKVGVLNLIDQGVMLV